MTAAEIISKADGIVDTLDDIADAVPSAVEPADVRVAVAILDGIRKGFDALNALVNKKASASSAAVVPPYDPTKSNT